MRKLLLSMILLFSISINSYAGEEKLPVSVSLIYVKGVNGIEEISCMKVEREASWIICKTKSGKTFEIPRESIIYIEEK